MNFDFLKTVTVEAPTKDVAKRTSAPKLPDGMRLRVFASGKVYPSTELVEKYDLEYTNKDAELSGNGFDMFKSSDWNGFPVDAPQHFIFIAAVPKSSPKVSLFGSCGYDESGAPKTTVTEQGGGSFGKELLEMVKEVYGVEVEKGDFIDLEINTEIAIPSSTDVYFLPKVVSRGEKKGQVSYVRRDSITVNPIAPVVEATQEEATEMAEAGDAETTTGAVVEENPTMEAPGLSDTPFENPSVDMSSDMPEMPVGLEV